MSSRDPELHRNHRERCFKTYLDSAASIPDHILLEMLLFYSIPRKDTNETAHRLLNTFGTLSGVFRASGAELSSVDGIGKYSADLIRLINIVKERTDMPDTKGRPALLNSEDYKSYLLSRFSGESGEALCLLIMDSKHRLINSPIICRGGMESTELGIKDTVRHVLCSSGELLVIGHCHPSRNAEPSDEDITFTLQLRRACDSLGIRLEDHVIISGKRSCSVFDYLSKHRPTRIETVVFNRAEIENNK